MPVVRRWLWLALVVLVLLAVGERWALPAWLARLGPTGEAQWISAPVEPAPEPVAGLHREVAADPGFFAVRDFELAAGWRSALLRVAGDEAFWVTLNGHAVAAGHYRPERPLVVSEVGQYLQAGANRLVVELRSARPAGGLLLALEIDGPEPRRIVSDRRWRVLRTYEPELSEIGGKLAGSAPAHVWGAPPTGRWGWPRETSRQPALADLLLPGRGVPARRARVGDPAGPWFRLPARPEQADPLAHWVTFDFGEIQKGFLSVFFRDKGPVKGLVFAGNSPPDPRSERPDSVLLKLAGLNAWTRAVPRRFRYVTVLATSKVTGAKVYAVAPQRAQRLLDPEPPVSVGAFGLEMPLRTAVEDEIWRDVERLASGRGGEDV